MVTTQQHSVLGVAAPAKSCTDKKCPFHGGLTVKPEQLQGKVVKKDTNRSATVEWHKSSYVPKYERYEIRRYTLRVHNPMCLDAQLGDEVVAVKTRPLSKTKDHVIIQVTTPASALTKREIEQEVAGKVKKKQAKQVTEGEQ